jgi:cobalt-precorrin 5A hydrolase
MRVAGFGFRKGATLAALQDALARAGGAAGLTALATVDHKAPALQSLADLLHLPIRAIPAAVLPNQLTLTQSARVSALYGAGSVAEAAALAAAGPGARLISARAQSGDGTATAAIAERVTQ